MISATLEAARYLDTNRAGYFAVLRHNPDEDTQHHCHPLNDLQSVVADLQGQQDTFISQQAFDRPLRRVVHVARLGVCYLDCDTRKSEYADLRPDQQAQQILFYCEDTGIPRPTSITFSGRGLHCRWIFDDTVPAGALPRWNATEAQLLERFKDFGADSKAKSAAQCLRLPGTINSRSGTYARTIYDRGPVWPFESLTHEVLPFTRAQLQAIRAEREERKSRTLPGNAENLWTPQKLWWARLADLRRLIILREWYTGVPKGMRDSFLFVAACAACWTTEARDIAAEVEALAAEFTPSLTTSEIRSCTSTALRRVAEGQPYKLKSQDICDWLCITSREQQHMVSLKDEALRYAETIEYDRQRHRKHSDRATYQATAEARRQQALHLYDSGLSYAQVAEQMNTTPSSIKTLLRTARRAKPAPNP
jgi:hypothetical protein